MKSKFDNRREKIHDKYITGYDGDKRLVDRNWFDAKWTDEHHFKRDWFAAKWTHRYKFNESK